MGKGFCSPAFGALFRKQVNMENEVLWQDKGVLGTEREIVLPGSDKNISITHFWAGG